MWSRPRRPGESGLAVLRACDQNVKRALAAKLGMDEKYNEARAALAPALRVAYERHGVLSTKDAGSAPEHVRSLLELVDGGGFRAGWGCSIEDDEASKTAS